VTDSGPVFLAEHTVDRVRRRPDRPPYMTESAISIDGLTKRYGETTAVSDLTTAVEQGSVYGFLGPNGAGKTTTMRMLTTLTRPTSGTATVAGHPITEREAVTPHIGYLPEDPPIYDELTGREQLEYVAGLRNLDGGAATERIESLLDRFDLTEDATKRISDYSKGMRQKVGVIQAILHEPTVAFLDEPTSGLDPRAARTMRDTIAGLAEQDMTIFLSTHILPVVDELADTIGVLHDGELVAEGDPETLKSRAEEGESVTLEDAFLAVTQERTEGTPDATQSL
jgi:ABC-2 type transport system ATP-binding protein